MVSRRDIQDRLDEVEEGDQVLWNGRKVPQPVTEVTDTYFIVKGTRGGHYRFHKTAWPPSLTNLNSNNDWEVKDFEIVSPNSRHYREL